MLIQSTHTEPQSLRHLVFGLHPLISWLKVRNIDCDKFLEHAHIPQEALLQPEYTISSTQEIGFITSVYKHLGQPELGLLMGPRYHLSSYGILGLAAMTSSNLLQCYEIFLDNLELTWTYFRLSVYTEGNLAFMQMDPLRSLGESMPYMIDRDLSAAYFIATEALEHELPLTQIEFQHSQTPYLEKYREVFKCPVKFNAKHNRFSFEKSWLERPLAKTEPETSRIFTSQCKRLAATMRSKYSYVEHIRYHLINGQKDTPSLQTLAKMLNTTPRTIQRKLAAENSSFQQLLTDSRVHISTEFLTTTKLTIEQIATHLGYNDAAAFSNAFKRWTGLAPTAFRQQRV